MSELSRFFRDDALNIPPWLWTGLAAVVSLLIVIVAMRIVRSVVRRAFKETTVWGHVVRRAHSPLTAVAAVAMLFLVLQAAPDQLSYIGSARHAGGVSLISAITWLLLSSVLIAGDAVIELNPYDAADNLRARRVLTQTRVLSRTIGAVILVVGISLALMTFPEVRHVGASLLASAGIAGLAVGLAAKPVLGNLLAGLQLALAQPIRIDDVVVVEGEWGRIEEITATYVVVAIWDQRRLILPLQYFIEKPFRNWTRKTSQILGTVFLWVDFRLPLEPVRAETDRLCKADPAWDGRVGIVQVTDANETTMQLRILLSAVDSGRSFDLCCRVREGLIRYIVREYPLYLPHVRAEVIAGETPPPSVPPPRHAAPAGAPSGAPLDSPTPTAPEA